MLRNAERTEEGQAIVPVRKKGHPVKWPNSKRKIKWLCHKQREEVTKQMNDKKHKRTKAKSQANIEDVLNRPVIPTVEGQQALFPEVREDIEKTKAHIFIQYCIGDDFYKARVVRKGEDGSIEELIDEKYDYLSTGATQYDIYLKAKASVRLLRKQYAVTSTAEYLSCWNYENTI